MGVYHEPRARRLVIRARSSELPKFLRLEIRCENEANAVWGKTFAVQNAETNLSCCSERNGNGQVHQDMVTWRCQGLHGCQSGKHPSTSSTQRFARLGISLREQKYDVSLVWVVHAGAEIT
ncbi:hypothetical protein HZ326_14390 [Fusarium oxysporum f. sp. albedinis]|nr:hypothetical protein HZ326_14390 [Fusarium oxysporum f. sp. albedinis]